jgi:hypothetical protein
VALPQKFHEAWNDATLNNAFDRRIFLLRQELAEFCSRVQLTIRVVRKDGSYHFLSHLDVNTSERVAKMGRKTGCNYRTIPSNTANFFIGINHRWRNEISPLRDVFLPLLSPDLHLLLFSTPPQVLLLETPLVFIV